MESKSGKTSSIKKITIVGTGTMGNGIAHIFALNGNKVNLVGRSASSLSKALEIISNNLDRQIAKGVITEENKKETLANITIHTSFEPTANSDLVIEAVPENIMLKQDIFKQLDELCSPNTILASTTSSISITKIASLTKQADRVIGIHFMNPVPVMKLAEIICGYCTSSTIVNSAIQLLKQTGMVPVEVEDYPGFITSRLLATMMNEAIYSIYEGVAGVEEIDTVMKLGMAHPMGPLQLADFVGLDIVLSALQTMYEGFKNPKYAPCPLLVNMVAAGHLGVKTGKGFYEYMPGRKDIHTASKFNRR